MIMYCLGVSDMANLSIFMPHTTTTRGPTLNTHIKQFNVADIYTFSDSHTHMLSHTTHSLSHIHTHTYTLPHLSHTHIYTLSLSHTHTHTHSLSHTPYTLSLTCSLSLSHKCTCTLTLTLSHTYPPQPPHTDTHSQIFELADDVRC